MGEAKGINVRVIPGKVAIPFIKKHHYSGKVVNNSSLHFGVFMNGVLHGVMSFGAVPRQIEDAGVGIRYRVERISRIKQNGVR